MKMLTTIFAALAAAAIMACGSAAAPTAPDNPTPQTTQTATTAPTDAPPTPIPTQPATATPVPTATMPPPAPTNTPLPIPQKDGTHIPQHGKCLGAYINILATEARQYHDQLPEDQVTSSDQILGVNKAKEAKIKLHSENPECANILTHDLMPDKQSDTDRTGLPEACLGIEGHRYRIGDLFESHEGLTLEYVLTRTYPELRNENNREQTTIPVRDGRTVILPKAMFILMTEIPHSQRAGCWLIAANEWGKDITVDNAVILMTTTGNVGDRIMWRFKTIAKLMEPGGGESEERR